MMATGRGAGSRVVRGSNRKREIVEQFAVMVAERGYEKSAIGDVAAKIGISKGTIVHHFGSKDAILEQVHHEFMRRRLDEIQAVTERLSSPVEQLGAMVYCLVLVYREDRPAALAFTREFVQYAAGPEMVGVRQLRREYFDLMQLIVQRGMDTGQFRREDPELTTLQVFGMCNWCWTWLRPDREPGVETVAAVFVRNLLGGLGVHHASSSLLDDPNGRIPTLVRELIKEAGE